MYVSRTTLTVVVVSCWLTYDANDVHAQVTGDGCPDLELPVYTQGGGFGKADNEDIAEALAFDDAVYFGCIKLNKLADYAMPFMTCSDDCVRTEAYWDWCTAESVTDREFQCAERGTPIYDLYNDEIYGGTATEQWICIMKVDVSTTAYAICEPEDIQP